jgi:hypothetical protein
MLVWLYGEMRDALWPEHGLSGSTAGCAADVAFLPVCYVLRGRARSNCHSARSLG